jgi:hypothetical protein
VQGAGMRVLQQWHSARMERLRPRRQVVFRVYACGNEGGKTVDKRCRWTVLIENGQCGIKSGVTRPPVIW